MLPVIVWNVSPDIATLGFLKLRYYGLLFATAVFSGYHLLQYVCKKNDADYIDPDKFFIYGFFGIVIGARLGHVLFYDPAYYFSNPLIILKIWEGGLASHGGALGLTVAVFFFCRNNKIPLTVMLDLVAITTMTCFLIRMGNFFNSEIIGKPTDLPWGVVFQRIDNIARHPAQLYEAIGYILILIILLTLNLKYKVRPGTLKLFGMLLILTFTLRFFVEFFKENQEGFEAALPINMGQILSVPLVFVGLYCVLIYKGVPVEGNIPEKQKPDKRRPRKNHPPRPKK